MTDVLKISIAVTRAQIAVLRAAVKRGEYATTSEAIREALREWQRKHGVKRVKPRLVRHKVKKTPKRRPARKRRVTHRRKRK